MNFTCNCFTCLIGVGIIQTLAKCPYHSLQFHKTCPNNIKTRGNWFSSSSSLVLSRMMPPETLKKYSETTCIAIKLNKIVFKHTITNPIYYLWSCAPEKQKTIWTFFSPRNDRTHLNRNNTLINISTESVTAVSIIVCFQELPGERNGGICHWLYSTNKGMSLKIKFSTL